MNQRVLVAYEWQDDSIVHCVNSNGRADKEKYLNFRQTNSDLVKQEQFRESYPESFYEFVQIDSISAGRKYVYLIPIKNLNKYFLPKFNSGLVLSDRVVSDVKNGNATIVLDYRFEGHLILHHVEQLNSLITELNLPKERILLLHGDYKVEKFKNSPYTYQPINIFTEWIDHDHHDILIDYIPKKLFVSYNRRMDLRRHRLLFMLHVYKNHLINQGIVSFGSITDPQLSINTSIRLDPYFSTEDIAIFNNGPVSHDFEIIDSVNPAKTINIEHHINTFMSVVSETEFVQHISFFSEKIYKPLVIGHPFIINGSPHLIKRLRDEGFKTFDRWWDESYDEETLVATRVKKIIDIIVKLSQLSDSALVSIRQEMRDTLMHNQRHFYKMKTYNDHRWRNTIQKLL
jgi:hypothetical protein